MKEVKELNDSKKELEKPSNLTINKGELQGSVEDFNALVEEAYASRQWVVIKPDNGNI